MILAASAQAAPTHSGMVRLPGHVLPALAKATVIPAQPGSGQQPITLTIVLRRDDEQGFERYLHELYDPHSKNFHRFVTQEQIADRFGPSHADYDAVLGYLRDMGFMPIRESGNRLTLVVSGTQFQAERAFQLHISLYREGDVRFYANDSDPELPADVARSVQAIIGLNNLARPKPSKRPLTDVGIEICKLGINEKETESRKSCISFVRSVTG